MAVSRGAESLKIGIVEDDLIIGRDISEMLLDFGYTVSTIATRYSEAIAMIEDEKPDILLLDIKISGRLDGISVAKTVKEQFNIPIIFLTGNSDTATINRAKPLNPAAYLTKPISSHQLFAAIEIAVATYTSGLAIGNIAANKSRDYIFIKDDSCYRRVRTEDIISIESKENYVHLSLLSDKDILVRSTLTDFTAQFDSNKFIRVHRSHTIALNKIKEVQSEQLIMEKNVIIPISRNYKENLMQLLLL